MRESLRLRAPAQTQASNDTAPPRVSVLVPAYNMATTIGEALDSALAQDPLPHEVIVSDDGSRDDLDRALRPFADRIRLVRGPNGGLAAARNRAAAIATGELLALLDADDVWLPGRVAALTSTAAARPDLAILTTDAVESRDGVRTPGTYYGVRPFDVDHQEIAILRENFIFGAGAVRADAFRAVGGYRNGARYAEDWDLWLRLLLNGHRAGLIEQPLYEYRRSAESLTGQKLALALGVLEVLARARSFRLDRMQREQLDLTEQRWRETAARAARHAADPRARRMALGAAAGAHASLRTRVRFGTTAILPRHLLRRRWGGR
jgi:glycosyltransferase involved in cell wall biosynthesis